MTPLSLASILVGKILLARLAGYVLSSVKRSESRQPNLAKITSALVIWFATTLFFWIYFYQDKESYRFIRVWDFNVIHLAFWAGILMAMIGRISESFQKIIAGVVLSGLVIIGVLLLELIIAVTGYIEDMYEFYFIYFLVGHIIMSLIMAYGIYVLYGNGSNKVLFASLLVGVATWAFLASSAAPMIRREYYAGLTTNFWTLTLFIFICFSVALLISGYWKSSKQLKVESGMLFGALTLGLIVGIIASVPLVILIVEQYPLPQSGSY